MAATKGSGKSNSNGNNSDGEEAAAAMNGLGMAREEASKSMEEHGHNHHHHSNHHNLAFLRGMAVGGAGMMAALDGDATPTRLPTLDEDADYFAENMDMDDDSDVLAFSKCVGSIILESCNVLSIDLSMHTCLNHHANVSLQAEHDSAVAVGRVVELLLVEPVQRRRQGRLRVVIVVGGRRE